MNRHTHLLIGGILFFAYSYVAGFLHDPVGELFVFGLIAVVAGSLFPDILEPATSGRHRGICHSRRALKLTVLMFLITAVPVFFIPGIPHLTLVFSTSSFLLGYGAHLLADSVTRAGLPG